ncbi:MAG: tRNA pseudouridine(38-40) synthase TruA [Candidatus Marinimicrobia bacterium]|nr:tRNA pseudouridine(38-40) synthase TruA [Candidatus Neomarinimicrobiota bacterium]
MTRYVLHVEYDGTAYAGFQLQADQPTVQGRLEEAAEALYKQAVRMHASGRTDAGVHAEHQIVHFDPPSELRNLNLKAAMNTVLPPDIRVMDTAVTDETFHARFSARERRYRYDISTGVTALDRHRVWQIFQDLDLKRMQACAELIVGEHDFTSFCSLQAEVDHKRCLIRRSAWERKGDRLSYHVHGNRFLHSMVRSLVGTMVEAGKHRLDEKDFLSILEQRDRLAGAVTAPPQGLFLVDVLYDSPIPWEKEP